MNQQDELLWGTKDSEELCETLEEAVCHELEDANLDEVTWPLIFMKFRRMNITEALRNRLASLVLERLIEDLDETYGSGFDTRPTKEMRDAAQAFVDVICDNYKVYNCEPVDLPATEIHRDQAEKILKEEEA